MVFLEFDVTRNNKVADIPKITKEWSLTVDIKPTGKTPGYTNLVHLTSTKKNCCGFGDRIPAIWFISKTSRLHICGGINRGNECYNSGNLPMNKYTTVLIEQKKEGDKYTLTILIDGKEFKKVDFKKEPREYGPSELFASDNFYNPGKAKIKNLKFINLGIYVLILTLKTSQKHKK